MTLDVLTRQQCQDVRKWRNDELQFLRTPYRLTEEMQDDFYESVVCNRDSKHRYYALKENGVFVGMGGLTNIEWENGCAEISLIINPDMRGHGYGISAVQYMLMEAFNSLRLETVHGEVYECGNVGFWQKVVEQYEAFSVWLPNRKYWQGALWDSLWFQLTAGPV